jgi:hypothetical protein
VAVTSELIDVVPRDGRAAATGPRSSSSRSNLQSWIVANAVDLIERGYRYIVVVEHVPSTVVGDRRARRRR